MRIAVAGYGLLGTRLTRALLDSHHEVVAIVQNGRKTRGIERAVAVAVSHVFATEGSMLGLAAREHLPVVWLNRMDESELAPLRALTPDLLLVGGFGIILKRPILDLPKIGCVNVHSSLLPKHRGPNPFSAVLLSNEPESGVTFHVMDEGIDTGDILSQYAFPIEPEDNAMSVYTRACEVARENVVDVVDGIEKDGLAGRPQDHALATYDERLTETNARVDWRKPAQDIVRLLRACRPFILPRFRARGANVRLVRATAETEPVNAEPGTILTRSPFLRVATGCGALTIESAYAAAPVPWKWPAPWNRVRPGQKLE